MEGWQAQIDKWKMPKSLHDESPRDLAEKEDEPANMTMSTAEIVFGKKITPPLPLLP